MNERSYVDFNLNRDGHFIEQPRGFQKTSSRFNSFISKNYYRRIRIKKQAWVSIDIKPVKEVLDNPHAYLTTFTQAERAVLNYLLVWSNSYRDMYFKQSTIAAALGCTRGFVNRTLRKLECCGLIVTNYRHMTSKQYKVSSWFNDMKVRDILASLFRAFVWFPIALLTATFPGSVTQVNSYIYNYNQLTLPYKDKSDIIRQLTGALVNSLAQKKPNPSKSMIDFRRDRYLREEQERNLKHNRGLAIDREKLSRMTRVEAEAYAQACIDISPLFGEFTAKAILAQYAQIHANRVE